MLEKLKTKPKFLLLPAYNNLLFHYSSTNDEAKVREIMTELNYKEVISISEHASQRRQVKFQYLYCDAVIIITIFFFFF
jgi:hypothetical protein